VAFHGSWAWNFTAPATVTGPLPQPQPKLCSSEELGLSHYPALALAPWACMFLLGTPVMCIILNS